MRAEISEDGKLTISAEDGTEAWALKNISPENISYKTEIKPKRKIGFNTDASPE